MKFEHLLSQAGASYPVLPECYEAIEAINRGSSYTILGKRLEKSDLGKIRQAISHFESLAERDAKRMRDQLVDGFIASSSPAELEAIREQVAQEHDKGWPGLADKIRKGDPRTAPSVRAKILELIPAPTPALSPRPMRIAGGY